MSKIEEQPFIVNQDTLEKEFKQHLAVEDNFRILFSGPFGQGKTTFLDKVFENEKESCHTIKLYPVNYSVSSNEDVFELIKFDIITQLIGKYGSSLDLQEEDFSKILTAHIFVRDRINLIPWVEAIFSSFGTIGKSASSFFSVLRDTVKDFDSFHKEVQVSEARDIKAFVDSLINATGSAYEQDVISQQINEFVKRLRKKSDHKIVLIIDDLDRLDPEHIFRLFNVFSTQFEHHGESLNGYNKFGFDRIIFVCDIENIRRIYRHKYGTGVDFKGYLDKFYSHKPFDFDNRRHVRDRVNEIVQGLHVMTYKPAQYGLDKDRMRNFMSALEWILISLINNRLLNLRSLIHVTHVEVDDDPIPFGRSGLTNSGYSIIILFNLLLAYFPSFEILQENLKQLTSVFDKNRNHRRSKGASDDSWIYNYIISMCIPFLADPKLTLVNYWPDENPKILFSPALKLYLHFSVKEHFDNRHFDFRFDKATIAEDIEKETIEIELNPYEVLSHTLQNLKKIGILD